MKLSFMKKEPKIESIKDHFFAQFGTKSFRGYPLEQCQEIWEFFERQKYLLSALSVEENEKGGWVSVKDGLPDNCHKKLVYYKSGGVNIAHYEDGGWWSSWPEETITHWMPLPDSPKDEKG